MKISFSSQQFKLSPFPIQGMFYYWSCDLVGKLPQTSKGNVYIMIMTEHFSKWVELIALLDKSSHNTNQAFLQQILNRFGACAKCLTDQGSKFRGNSKTYLIMLSLTIVGLQGIIPKLMALQRGWFKHSRRGFKIFASLGIKRIGT